MTEYPDAREFADALTSLYTDRDNEEHWRVVFTGLYPRILTISVRWLRGDQDLADDNCQETFIKLARTLARASDETLFHPAALRQYATRVTVNTAIDSL